MRKCWQDFCDEERTQFWASLALRHSQGLGPRSVARLLHYFGSAYDAVQNTKSWDEAGIPAHKAAQFATGAWRTSAQKEWNVAQCTEMRILMWHHREYPSLLRALIDAPCLLYYRGDVSLLAGPCFAVVGSRNCTAEGVRIASLVTRDMTKAGVTVVSGMAQGIDRVAHVAALEGIGKSIAVLGTGIDVVYPQKHKDIYERLIHEGLVVSEFAPGTSPNATNFPVRNRVISGVSLGVLVVEGALRSGSLITARQALEQNRDVFAVPGLATSPASHGCQELIRQGAKPVFHAEDILRDLTETLRAFSEAKKLFTQAHKHEHDAVEQGASGKAAHVAPPATEIKIGAPPSLGCVYMERVPFAARSRMHALDECDNKRDEAASSMPCEESNTDAPDMLWQGTGKVCGELSDTLHYMEFESASESVLEAAPVSSLELAAERAPDEQEAIQCVLDTLHAHSEADIDTLCLSLKKTVHYTKALLIEMELSGLVKKLPGGRYAAQSATI